MIEPRNEVDTMFHAPNVVDRYRDGYRVAGVIDTMGLALKVIGAVLAGIIIIGASKTSASEGVFGNSGSAILIVAALVIGGLFWVAGVIVSAQGQILQASLDTAVSASRFLTDPQRAQAMGLSGGHAASQAATNKPKSPEELATERAKGIQRCKVCGLQIPPSARQVCKEKELCEDHL